MNATNNAPKTLTEAVKFFADPEVTHNYFTAMRWRDAVRSYEQALKADPSLSNVFYKMARSYNDRLRAHLGLPPIVEDPTQPHASSPAARSKQLHISLLPALAPDSGGLLVVGSF